MAEGISGGNGSLPISSFDIPAPNFVEQGTAQAIGMKEAGWFDDLIRKYFLAHGSIGETLLSVLGSNFDDIMAVFVKFVGAAQAGGTPGFFALLSTLLGDLLGMEMSPDAVANAWKHGGSMAGFKAVGSAYWNAMLGQLGSPAAITPESGLAAAEGFIGYLLGFSIREGNIAMLASIIPEEVRIMDGIDEYAQAMRSSLGLGRMARQVLHPLIQTVITDPLQWYVNRRYTPKLLGEGLAVRAFNHGWIDRAALEQEMSYAGYSEQRIQTLIQDALTQLSLADAWTLYKTGTYTSDQLTAAYQASGMNPSVSGDWLAARIAAEVEPYTVKLIDDWKTQLAGGYIKLPQFLSHIDDLKLPIDVKNAIKDSVSQLYELPRKKLTLAELQSAFVEGLIDATDVSSWLQNEGYSDDDAQVLWFQTLLKLGTLEAKKAVAQYAYDKAKAKAEAKGEAPPPPPAVLAT